MKIKIYKNRGFFEIKELHNLKVQYELSVFKNYMLCEYYNESKKLSQCFTLYDEIRNSKLLNRLNFYDRAFKKKEKALNYLK